MICVVLNVTWKRSCTTSALCNFDFGVGWHAPEYSKGVMEYDSARPSSTQGRATLNHQPQFAKWAKHWCKTIDVIVSMRQGLRPVSRNQLRTMRASGFSRNQLRIMRVKCDQRDCGSSLHTYIQRFEPCLRRASLQRSTGDFGGDIVSRSSSSLASVGSSFTGLAGFDLGFSRSVGLVCSASTSSRVSGFGSSAPTLASSFKNGRNDVGGGSTGFGGMTGAGVGET